MLRLQRPTKSFGCPKLLKLDFNTPLNCAGSTMESIEFPQDFSEFLKLLNDHHVEYLLIGGFAVAMYGYPRATADMDVWVAQRRENAERIVQCLREFGFDTPDLTADLFNDPDRIIRMGEAPLRIEILTAIDGVEFDDCASRAETQTIEGIPVPVISLNDLKTNKRASGRPKDLDDLENLP
jgi:predicted nucleotidyltransferase